MMRDILRGNVTGACSGDTLPGHVVGTCCEDMLPGHFAAPIFLVQDARLDEKVLLRGQNFASRNIRPLRTNEWAYPRDKIFWCVPTVKVWLMIIHEICNEPQFCCYM